ncbi:MAG TPA: hypothetical protein VF786_10545 [Terriglobales bacterium]
MSAEPVGIPLPLSIIDEEHRDIHRAIVNATNSILLGEPVSVTVQAAEHALQVTLLHFEHEEALLRVVRFRRLRSHCKEHLLLTTMLRVGITELKNKATGSALAIFQNYKKQLIEHLQVTDEKYRESVNRYMISNGMAPLPHRIRHSIQ